MLTAHTASFLKLIDKVLEDISRGVANDHHLHNVHCGIENILALLENNNSAVEHSRANSRVRTLGLAHVSPIATIEQRKAEGIQAGGRAAR